MSNTPENNSKELITWHFGFFSITKQLPNNGSKNFGAYASIVSGVLALAAAICYHFTIGTYGNKNPPAYNNIVLGLLGASLLVVILFTLIKRYGLASLAATALPGIALLFFAHDCYWYVTDVFVGIDEKTGFAPGFLAFAILVLAAFIVGEIAIYAPKAKKQNA